jgi:hypothetical protein
VPRQSDPQRHPRAGIGRQGALRRRVDQRVEVGAPAEDPARQAARKRPVVGAVDAVEGVGERGVERFALREDGGQQAQRGAAGRGAGGVGGGQWESRVIALP